MRFHFGFSFRPKNIIKYILLGIMVVLAFFGISQVNAETISPSEVSATNGNTNIIYCNSNLSNYCPSTFNPYSPPYTEYAGIKYINIDYGNNSLTSGHNYTFDIVFQVARPVSLNDFEQESLTLWQYSGFQLNDTTIVWNQTNTYEQQTGIWYTYFHFRGQFTPNSTSAFYVRLTLEQFESIYGITVLSTQIVDDNSNDELIESNYQNTQNIISNNNSNTSNIINNNNSNTQQIIDNQNNLLGDKCSNLLNYSNYSNAFNGASIVSVNDNSISINSSIAWGWLQYEIPTTIGDVYYVKGNSLTSLVGSTPLIQVCADRDCVNMYYSYENNGSFSSSFAASSSITYFRLFATKGIANQTSTYNNVLFSSQNTSFCKYGSTLSKIDTTNQSIQDLNDTISDDSIDVTSSNSFFGNFNNNTHGLTGIITLPLTTIQNLNNASCTPLSLTIPFISSNNNLQLPCLTPIYQSNFGTFFTLYQTILFGFVSYYVCINVFHMVKDFKDPNKDKIEVMDL